MSDPIEVLLKEWPPHLPLPDKYNDGSWWCEAEPGCRPIACCGHKTFGAAIRATVKRIREMRRAGEWEK